MPFAAHYLKLEHLLNMAPTHKEKTVSYLKSLEHSISASKSERKEKIKEKKIESYSSIGDQNLFINQLKLSDVCGSAQSKT